MKGKRCWYGIVNCKAAVVVGICNEAAMVGSSFRY